MGQLLSNLANGSLVKLNENTQARKFIKLDNDHYGSGTGVTLIRKDAFSEAPWTAGWSSSRSWYFGSMIDNFCDGIWPLKLDEEIRECIVPVPIVVAVGHGVSTLHTIYRKGFALSCTEVMSNNYWQTEGTAFSYFSSKDKRIAYLDETTAAVNWGTRSPAQDNGKAYRFTINGDIETDYCYLSWFAPRPAFNLKSAIVVSDTKDSDGCYTVESLPAVGSGASGGVYVKQNGVWVRAS